MCSETNLKNKVDFTILRGYNTTNIDIKEPVFLIVKSLDCTGEGFRNVC